MTQTEGRVARPGEPARHLPLPGVFNLRDVGGYPAADGRIRWRTLFRSDALFRLDDDGLATMAGLGLRTIVDLRTQLEVDFAPTGPVRGLAGAQARTAHISLLTGELQDVPVELAAVYQHFVARCGDRIAAAIGELCQPDVFPALVHCSAGKDRTGIVIALVLAVLGVPDEVIATDYALSEVYLDQESTPAIGQLRASSGLGDKLTSALLSSPRELILDTLAQVRAAGGGSVEGYLTAHGLTRADLAALRASLTE